MSMNIKNDEAHRMARQLADLDQSTVTDAVTTALREALAHRRSQEQAKVDRIKAILERMRNQLTESTGPALEDFRADLYDHRGLPR